MENGPGRRRPVGVWRQAGNKVAWFKLIDLQARAVNHFVLIIESVGPMGAEGECAGPPTLGAPSGKCTTAVSTMRASRQVDPLQVGEVHLELAERRASRVSVVVIANVLPCPWLAAEADVATKQSWSARGRSTGPGLSPAPAR